MWALAPPVSIMVPSSWATATFMSLISLTARTPGTRVMVSRWCEKSLECPGVTAMSTPSYMVVTICVKDLLSVAVKMNDPETNAVPRTTARTVRASRILWARRFREEMVHMGWRCVRMVVVAGSPVVTVGMGVFMRVGWWC